MTENEVLGDLRMPHNVWIEIHAGDDAARDVIVEMEDGVIYTAVFVTPPYIQRQMNLMFDFCKQMSEITPTRFAALDTPHVVLESLDRDTIEDTVDNLLAMEMFTTMFTQVTEDENADTSTTTNGNGRRATQEVAAVVLSDVLVVEA